MTNEQTNVGAGRGFGPILRLRGETAREFRRRIGTALIPIVRAAAEPLDAGKYGQLHAFAVDGNRLPPDARLKLARWILRTTDQTLDQMLADINAGKVLLPFKEYELLWDDPLAWG
jgi:hypothetical protein